MAPILAPCLVVLRDQINAAFPDRSKKSDGWIGDKAHAARKSDHNPIRIGKLDVVLALDITHDPANGVDIDKFTDELAAARDRRMKYMIANALIMDTRPPYRPWTWQPYRGANLHYSHVHISVLGSAGRWDDDDLWNLPMLGRVTPPPLPSPGTSLPQHRTGSRVLAATEPYPRGTDVRDLQRILNRWYPSLDLTEDGVYGPRTAKAVRQLQARARITIDGIAGPQTYRALNIL